MVYNSILDVVDTTSGSITEPVTLDEAKLYLRVSNDIENDLISSLIVSARLMLEKYTGFSLVEKTFTIIINNSLGNCVVPYGPYDVDDITASDNSDIVVKKRNRNVVIESPITDYLSLDCEGGYTSDTLPENLKTAIKEQVSYMYLQRDNVIPTTGLCDKARQYASTHKSMAWVL